MYVENERKTTKMLNVRVDDEMFYSLKALSDRTSMGISPIMRLALAQLLAKAREKKPSSWDELKNL